MQLHYEHCISPNYNLLFEFTLKIMAFSYNKFSKTNDCSAYSMPSKLCILKLDSIYMYHVTNYLFNDKYKHVGIRYYILYGLHVVVNVQNVFVWYFLTSLTVNNQYWLFSSFNKCLKSHQYVVSDPTQETK